MNVIVKPKKLSGNVIIPPSKSLSHRAIIAAGLASGKSIISNVLYSKDIKATIGAMRACGATIIEHPTSLEIYGSKVVRKENIIDAYESGSTIRFMIPIALVCPEKITFIGHNHLVKRPLDTFFEIFDKEQIPYKYGNDYLPLEVNGGLKPGKFEIRDGRINNLDFDAGIGDVYIKSKLEGSNKIDTGVGKVTLDLIGRDYKLSVEKGIGTILIDNKKAVNNETFGNGKNHVLISGGVGEIEVNYVTE